MNKLTTLIVSLILLCLNHGASAETFFDANFTGKHVEKFADGTPKYEVNIIKGKKEGLEIFWYPSGKK